MAWLVALDGGLAGRKFPLDTTFLVGRGPFNHVVLDDATISRQHAKIAPETEGHVVYDLGSANGTFVNDQPVKRQALAMGDMVRFGPFRFRFESAADEQPVADVRASRHEEMTRVGFEAPAKIVGEADAQVQRSLITTGGLAELNEAERRLRTLFSFVHAIAATLDAGALLDLMVENLFAAFPGATVAAVYTLDPGASGQGDLASPREGLMVPQRARTRDAREIPHYPLPGELYRAIVQGGKALLSTPMSIDWDDDGGVGPTSGRRQDALLMHAPMMSQGNVLGVLNVRCDPGSSFSQGDLDLLTALASHAAMALENAKLHQASLAQQRLQRDLALAQQIQKSFLPLALPRAQGLSFAAEYRPAYDVGGDFYDVFWIDADRIACVIGDVSGKGIPASLLMARVSSDLRTAMLTTESPSAALARANTELCARQQHDIFVTAVAITIHVPSRVVTLANAGHMPPYVRGAAPGDLLRIDDGSSSPLGLFEEIPYTDTQIKLRAGDTLVLTTDGVHEATDPDGQQLGFEGVEAALRVGPSDATSVAARLLAAVNAHARGAREYDDLTLLCCGAVGPA